MNQLSKYEGVFFFRQLKINFEICSKKILFILRVSNFKNNRSEGTLEVVKLLVSNQTALLYNENFVYFSYPCIPPSLNAINNMGIKYTIIQIYQHFLIKKSSQLTHNTKSSRDFIGNTKYMLFPSSV